MPGWRHLPKVTLTKGYSDAISIKTFSTGERRVIRDPPKETVKAAFDEFGTHKSVAAAFGVSRGVVTRWLRDYDMEVISRPEIAIARSMTSRLNSFDERSIVAQWIMDEGSISVNYALKSDLTSLVVGGSMNDYEVLSRMSTILGTSITSSKSPQPTVLPTGVVKVSSAKAYAMLKLLLPHLMGLKAMEAKAALQFFPASGTLRGRHTTDEFLLDAWKSHALQTIRTWNLKRISRMNEDEIMDRTRSWLDGRVRRSHRFVSTPTRKLQDDP